MATLEEFEECYREVKTWHEANFQSLNEAEKVQYHQATRNFQATKYY